ncbi:MAG TPA: hypothetical protein VJ111_18100, partial [Chitinophagaceae bacterium]|nr:hypothetical protein [Chitinophagaceae bacterium]
MIHVKKGFALSILLFSFLGCLMLVSAKSMAQGDLLIYPKRITFEGSGRTQQLNLSNNGKDTARYVISVIQIRMKDDGSFETINLPDSGQHFSDNNFRFFPRNVVLAPNEGQTVKIQLVKTNELEPGEYRSHIYFRAESEKKPLGEEKSKQDSSISVRLVPVFGISIPVIIRVGESTMDMSFSKIAFQLDKDTVPVLKMDLNRTGNMSVYGDISVDYISEQGKVTRVAMAKGLAVYTPNAQRHFRLLLDKNPEVNYHTGTLHIVFTDQS